MVESTQIQNQHEIRNCFFVKAVLLIFVVVDHSAAFWTGAWFTKDPVFPAEPLKILSSWLGTIHTYGFVLISGYVFYNAKHEQGKYSRFGHFVLNKAKRLLVPYVVVAALWVIPVQCAVFDSDIQTIITNYLLAINPSQLWFLLMLFDVFVVFWWLSDFIAKHNVSGAAVVLLLYGFSLIGNMIIPNVFMIWRALNYLPIFWLGFKLRQYGTKLIRRIPVLAWLVIHILMFVLAQYLARMDSPVVSVLRYGVDFALNLIGAIMAFLLLQKLAEYGAWKTPFFLFLSKRSMAVYLFHQQIIYVCIIILNGVVNPYINAIINFLVAMGISLTIAGVLLRFPATRAAIGEKKEPSGANAK